MQFSEGAELVFKKLDTHRIMALAASSGERVTVRNVSCIFYDGYIYFKTDREFPKTKIMLDNPRVALCYGGVQVEGTAKSLGLVAEEEDHRFETLYEKYWATSYNAYPHKETEILIQVTPFFAEVWDQDENNNGFQVLVDFEKKTAELKQYD